jgi:hypothetical protein
MFTIYALSMQGDCEGRSERTVGYFTQLTAAQKIGQTGFGSMGMGIDPGHILTLVVCENIDEFIQKAGNPDCLLHLSEDPKVILKQQALAKLTLEERAALGLF